MRMCMQVATFEVPRWNRSLRVWHTPPGFTSPAPAHGPTALAYSPVLVNTMITPPACPVPNRVVASAGLM